MQSNSYIFLEEYRSLYFGNKRVSRWGSAIFKKEFTIFNKAHKTDVSIENFNTTRLWDVARSTIT